jgi:hypothetical protein
MSLNDVFGHFPDRPDHPDFAKLSDLVLQQDGWSCDENFDYEQLLEQYVDPKSVAHMATQRATKALANTHRDPAVNADLVAALSAIYLDAFVTGYRFHVRTTRTNAKELLAGWLASECSLISERSGGQDQGTGDSARSRASVPRVAHDHP